MRDPTIKWSGSKRSQAERIVSFFPRKIGTYYEPFCGGCSVLRRLLDLPPSEMTVGRYVCSDVNSDLIDLWNAIKGEPFSLAEDYASMWGELNSDSDIGRKKTFYGSVRERFNRERNPSDFLFLMRTAMNGMPRYNGKGEFNTSLHLTRDGIRPERLKGILEEWSGLLNSHGVEFVNQSYDHIHPERGDFVYLDPPYAATKGMYYGGIGLDSFWGFLRGVPCGFALSFDGRVGGGEDLTYAVPSDLYSRHEYINSGNSSFRRIVGNRGGAEIHESLYLKS